MEGVEGDDCIEGGTGRGPVLERGDDDPNAWECGEIPPRHGGKALTELDSDDLEPALGEKRGGLPGSAADLDEACARAEPGELDQIVDELAWRGRPRAVVELRRIVERGPEKARVGFPDHDAGQ